MRTIAVHYHIFKNAGSSVDQALLDNFGDSWTQLEAAPTASLSPLAVRDFLAAHPNIKALSSHTAALPPEPPSGSQIIPIVFLRHPLDRLRSVYEFERVQHADTPGAQVARSGSIQSYFRWHLDNPRDEVMHNFQTKRMATGTPAESGLGELDRARATIAALAFVGLVEAYDKSISRLEQILARDFDRIELRKYRLNATRRWGVLQRRLEMLEERLGAELYAQLAEANASDVALWTELGPSYGVDVDSLSHLS